MDIEYLLNEECYKKLYNQMPDFRKEKADKYKFMKDKACSVGAWGLLLHALREQGIDSDTDVSYNEQGKPYFPTHQDVFFNLSHSGTKVMCAISDKPIGCDTQKMNEKDDTHLSIARRFFTENEFIYLNELSADDRKTEFYRIWTLKESYVKMAGTGLAKDLSEFEIVINKDRVFVNDDSCYCHEIDMFKDYRFAYCSAYEADEEVTVIDRI